MFKEEALVTAEKLEIVMQDHPLILKELETLKKRIEKGNSFEIGISYGRVEYAIESSGIEASRNLVLLHKYLVESEKELSEMTLDNLRLGVRLSNYCKRAGIYTVKDLYDTKDLRAIFPKNGEKYYQDLVRKLDEIGIHISVQ